MSNMSKISKFSAERRSGSLSREEYWTIFQEILRDLSDFASFQNKKEVGLLLKDNEIFVDMKCTETHTTRVTMLLDKSDIRSVPFSVLADGYYEPFQSDLLISLGNISESFFDIGSNMGFYSLALAVENPNLRVDAFEPQPSVFNILKRNVEINKLSERINIHNKGLGETPGVLTMYIPKFTGSGGASFKNLHEDEGDATEISVPVVVLDKSFSKNVDLIKIDVEGSELNVIVGAKATILDYKPTIMVELLRKWMKPFGHTPQMFLDELLPLEYRCFAIRKSDLIEIRNIDEDTTETNFVFIHMSKTEHLAQIHSFVS
jgi:FkbM family methyltransferase